MPDTRPPVLDEIDRQLIAALQINARESVAMLARQLGIARTTVTSRLARLEKAKVITGYGVRLGQRVVGWRVAGVCRDHGAAAFRQGSAAAA